MWSGYCVIRHWSRLGYEAITLSSKTASPLKGVFDQAKAKAAEAVMQPQNAPTAPRAVDQPTGARNRKAGGRGVRVSGYLPVEIEAALRDEVIRRTVAEHRTVSLNDVLVGILTEWASHQ
jgi:hypothetical protein